MTDHKLRILHVEDSSTDAELIRRFLLKQDFDFEIFLVETLEDFNYALSDFKPDIVLSDYKLPGANGEEFLRDLRALDKNLPFVFVTGAIGEDTVSELLHKGADDYVLKDRLLRLPVAIRGALREAEKHRDLIAAEKALEQSEARYKSLVESTSDFIWEVDANGLYQYVSPQTLGLYGCEEHEVIGKSPFDFMGEAEARRVGDLFVKIVAEKQPFYLLQSVIENKKGESVVLETSGHPFFDDDGNLLGYRGIGRDITDRIKSDIELRNSEKRYRLLTESSLDGIWDWNIETGQIYFSPKWKKQLGYEDEELVNAYETWESNLHPEDKPGVVERLKAFIKNPKPLWHEEFRMQHKDGSYRWIMARATSVISSDGKLSRLFGVHIDIDDYKNAARESNERVKELACLYNIQKDLEEFRDENFIMQRVVEYLVPAMQYPENTIATLTLKNKTFRAGKDTDSFAEDLNADLIINGEKIGMVSVRNHEPKGFLEPDEPQLVKNVARVLSRWLEKEKAFDHLRMYERVVSNTKDLMSFVSKDYRYLLVNQRYAEMHNKPIDQIQGRLVSEIMGDEVFASTIKPQLDKCFNDKNHISYQESFEMGGDEYTLHVEYDPLIENDEVKGAVVSVRDITELDKARKAIELEARRSKALLDLPLLSEKFGENEFLQKAQEIAESLTQSKISFIHFVNYEETEIELVTWSKRTLEEYCQAAYDKHYPVKQAGIWADAIRQKEPVVFNDYEKFPNKHGLPEGHARLKRMISVPVVEQGKVVMVAGVGNKEHEYVAEDVETVQLICNEIWRIVQRQRYRVELESSVQKRTAELADAMRRMQLAAEATSIGIWEYDVATEELVWDHWMYRIFEFPPDRFHGNLHDLESCLHPDDREYAIKQITNSIKQVVPLDMAFRIITPAGHLRYIQTKAIVRKDQDGAPVKVVGTSLDVSAQYELNENLKMAVKVAESANREKSAFLANMSHEIRTPLNAILGMTYLLMQDSSINTKALAQIKKVESSGKHLLALINDILDLSKIDAGKIELEKVSFNLKELLDNVAFMMHDEAMLKGLKLRVKSRNASCHVLGDPTRLNQVLLNLVGNGIKFTDEGSITINAECTEISEEKLLLHFDVIDTGIGIDKEAQSHLFQAFKQADSSTTRKYGGTGLGLAVCQKLVDEMDGTIGIDSEPGKGSRFWFEIKLDADNEVPVDGSADSKVDGQGEELDKRRKIENIHGASILLVEDDTINQEVAKGLLGKLDASVEIAPNGQEAVNLFLNRQSFDLVLMDIHMPVMDGYQATREIRALENGKNIPILAMTANAFADHKTESYEAGMNDFITKPVEPERLFNKLLEWLPENVFVFDNHQAEESGSAPDIDENQRRKLKDYFLSVDSIDIKRGLLSLNGDIDQYLSLARMFVSQHRQDAGLMESCIVDQAWEDARGIAHKAKGAAGTLGIIKIHSAAESLEKLFKQKTYNPEMPLQLEKFKSAYDELKRLIDQAPKSDAQQLSAPVSMQSVNELLDELKFLLDQGNAKAIDLFELNKAELESVFGDAVQGLQDNIENFNFDSALSDVESLLSVLSQQN